MKGIYYEVHSLHIMTGLIFSLLNVQAPAIVSDYRPPDGWPTHGHVKFNHYSTRYREGLDLVIRDIQAEVPGGTKVHTEYNHSFLYLLYIYL